MVIKDAKFIKSSSKLSEGPNKSLPEFIFLMYITEHVITKIYNSNSNYHNTTK